MASVVVIGASNPSSLSKIKLLTKPQCTVFLAFALVVVFGLSDVALTGAEAGLSAGAGTVVVGGSDEAGVVAGALAGAAAPAGSAGFTSMGFPSGPLVVSPATTGAGLGGKGFSHLWTV